MSLKFIPGTGIMGQVCIMNKYILNQNNILKFLQYHLIVAIYYVPKKCFNNELAVIAFAEHVNI